MWPFPHPSRTGGRRSGRRTARWSERVSPGQRCLRSWANLSRFVKNRSLISWMSIWSAFTRRSFQSMEGDRDLLESLPSGPGENLKERPMLLKERLKNKGWRGEWKTSCRPRGGGSRSCVPSRAHHGGESVSEGRGFPSSGRRAAAKRSEERQRRRTHSPCRR